MGSCGESNMKTFSLMSWNILAPMWIDTQSYVDIGADLNLLHIHKRLLLVIDRLIESKADVINLQEVQENQFKIIEADLAQTYSCSGFSPHKEGYWTDEWLVPGSTLEKNGQATFYRKSKFDCAAKYDIQTSSAGNVTLFTVLQIKYCRNSPTFLLVVNCHLESGPQEWKVKTRIDQATKIHKEILRIEEDFALRFKNSAFHVVLLGDFNSYGDHVDMREIRKLGFMDVTEMTEGKPSPTFHILHPQSAVQLDHITLMKKGLDAGSISTKHYKVPSVESPEYDEEAHEATIMDAIKRRSRRNESKSVVDQDPLIRDIISHIKPSSLNTKESNPVRALRCGSDHLPVYAEIVIQ